jgi:hypothetical protein
MDDTSVLLRGVLFGAIGLGFIIYGRRQQAIAPLVSGITLIVPPYLISNIYILLLAGMLLVTLPYFL